MKVLLAVILIATAGCTNVLLEPSQRIHDHQLNKYMEYIEADETLTDRDKRYQRELIDKYGKLVDTVR